MGGNTQPFGGAQPSRSNGTKYSTVLLERELRLFGFLIFLAEKLGYALIFNVDSCRTAVRKASYSKTKTKDLRITGSIGALSSLVIPTCMR